MAYRNKVRPIPMPTQPREVIISTKSPWKTGFKWASAVFIGAILGAIVWVGYSANNAIGKITGDSNGRKSSLLSFLGEFSSSDIKGQSQGRTNILILGMGGPNHPGGMLSDTMMVMSIDYNQKKVAMISVPRDLWAPIPGYDHAKINEAHADGQKNVKTTGGGGALASRTVENVLGIPIHYYITLDFEGFKKIVDTVGGVDVYVEKDIYDPFYPASDMIHYEPFRISAGAHHLDGATALKYARSRETTSDFDRSRRQMQVMLAVKEKLLTLGFMSNPAKVADLLTILGDHIRTNMQVSEMRALWDVSKNLDTANMINKVFDVSVGGPLLANQDSRGYYIYPRKGMDNFTDLQSIAQNIFSATQNQTAQINIEVLNASGRTGLASSVAHYLESYGYTIVKISNADTKTYKTTVIDYSGGKYLDEAEKIRDLLRADIQTGTLKRNDIQIQVLVGRDYLGNQ